MAIYWIIFAFPALFALGRVRVDASVWLLAGLTYTLIIGLRYYVGGDFFVYSQMVFEHGQRELISVLTGREPLFALLNWLAFQLGFDVWFVNLICAAIFMTGLISFVRTMPYPMLALTAAIPYLVIIVSMGYTRQAVAIGIFLWGLRLLETRGPFTFMMIIGLAATFHRTAIVYAGLVVLTMMRRGIWTFLVMLPLTYVLYILMISESQDKLIEGYLVSGYGQTSSGGLIRVVMNAAAAGVFLLIKDRIDLSPEQRSLWFWAALLSLGFLVLVQIAPVATDRIALYFLPLQILVVGYAPSAVDKNSRSLVIFLALLLYFLALFVWLGYADNRRFWLPYRFWLFEQ